MSALTDLEQAVLDQLLEGPDRIELRRQADSVEVAGRRTTGVGFFTDLLVDPAAPLATPLSQALGKIGADIEGVRHGVGFVLFVRDGRLAILEGYTYDEEWPDRVTAFRVRRR